MLLKGKIGFAGSGLRADLHRPLLVVSSVCLATVFLLVFNFDFSLFGARLRFIIVCSNVMCFGRLLVVT